MKRSTDFEKALLGRTHVGGWFSALAASICAPLGPAGRPCHVLGLGAAWGCLCACLSVPGSAPLLPALQQGRAGAARRPAGLLALRNHAAEVGLPPPCTRQPVPCPGSGCRRRCLVGYCGGRWLWGGPTRAAAGWPTLRGLRWHRLADVWGPLPHWVARCCRDQAALQRIVHASTAGSTAMPGIAERRSPVHWPRRAIQRGTCACVQDAADWIIGLQQPRIHRRAINQIDIMQMDLAGGNGGCGLPARCCQAAGGT
jgi:hypothetical protein